jgi:hypothetical protein
MGEPIGMIKFWKPKDDWYYLSPADRKVYLDSYANVVRRAEKSGAKLLGSYKCRGQSTWARFEVWEFPDLRDIIDFTNNLEEIAHFRYFAEENTVGRRYEKLNDPTSWVI